MPTSLIAAVLFAGDSIMMAAALGAAGMAAASFAVTFVISSLVSRAFAPGDPNANMGTDSGVRQQNPPSPTNNIPIVYGDAYLGGTFVDAVLSSDQKTMYYVLVISSLAKSTSNFIFDQTKFYYADRTITFDTTDQTKVISLTDGANNVDTKVSGNLFISLYTSSYAGVITGANTSILPSVLMGGADINVDQRWSATNRQMNGLAFAIIKLNYSRDADTTQMQPVTFKVGQYLNGASAAYPGAVWLDYMTSTVYGAGMVAGLVDSTSAAALDTYSQETITFTDSSGVSSTQPRYKINGVIDTGQNVLANIDRIMLACDSWNQYNEANGKWAVVINKAVASTFSFDDSNVIGEIKTSLLDLASSINQVEAQFPSKLNRDQRDVVYLETPSGLLYANEPINKYSCNLDLVNDSVQASYLANRMLEQTREDLIVTINAAYTAIQVDAGDVVTLTNAAYGWDNKLFRVMKVSEISLPDGNLGATLDLTEYNSQVYDNAAITQYTPAPNSNFSSPSYFSAVAAPIVSATRPADSIPSFDVAVVAPTVGRITNIQLFYSTVPTPTASQWTFFDSYTSPASTSLTPGSTFTFLNEMLPAGTYYFGVVVSNNLGQSKISSPSSALAWAPTGTVGQQTAVVSLYQWLNTTPGNPSGSTTWTWATASNASYTGGNGWQVAIPTNPGTPNTYLWQASTGISAPAGTLTTTVSWTSGFSVQSIARNGATGNSAVICYALYAGNPTVTGSPVTIAGSGLPATTSFSPTSATAFTTTVQNPGSSQAMFQSDGIYYPVTNQTVWGTPYLSNLKVGNLSAISADLGTITAGTITGALIQTASAPGKRVVMNYTANTLQVYDASNILVVEIGGTSGSLYVNSATPTSPASLIQNNSGSTPAAWGYNTATTASLLTAAGVYGLSNAANGVVGEANTTGVGVYGVARTTGGTNHGIRGVNLANTGGGTSTSGIVGAANGYDFYADGAGTNYGPFTGAHDVLVPISANIPMGYIVCDVKLIIAKNISNTLFEVAMSSSANQVPIGIMVLNNGLLANAQPTAFIEKVEFVDVDGGLQKITTMFPEYDEDKNLYDYCAANSVGEGQMYVCGEAGNITAGDLIVTSSVAGVGMKQADNIVRNITVAKARQSMTFTDTTTAVLVACIYLCG